MPPAGKAQAALRKQKDARQKKMLIMLAPVFLGLVAWQGPGILKAFSGSEPTPAPAAAPASTTPIDPTAAAAPSTAAPATPPAATGGALPDTDVPVAAGADQLVTFDRFVGKDPFKQQVSAKEDSSSGGNAPPAGADTGSGDGSGNGGSNGGTPPPLTPPPGGGGGGSPDRAGVATIDVNGTPETAGVGDVFPASEPIFRIVSLSAKSAKIGLVTGEFSTGRPTITLKLGQSLTLVSQPDGLRYTITLVRVA